jgi:hypothetical protein
MISIFLRLQGVFGAKYEAQLKVVTLQGAGRSRGSASVDIHSTIPPRMWSQPKLDDKSGRHIGMKRKCEAW